MIFIGDHSGDAMAQLFTNIDEIPKKLHSAALAVGNFDGVHRGHAQLISDLVLAAKKFGGPAVVLTFDPPPQAILAPHHKLPPPITTIARRSELLAALGVDALIAYPTDQRLLSLSPQDFFHRIVVGKLKARAMVEGPNFRFGRDRAGDVEMLERLCDSQGMRFEVVEMMADADGMISSTRIRNMLAAGEVAAANRMLTQPLELRGKVAGGARRGRELGFPTANLTDIQSLIPAQGVYAGSVQIGGADFPAALNIGPNPTFDDAHPKVEVHIIGWGGTLYGRSLACHLKAWIRGIRKFDSVADLQAQIEQDVAICAAHYE